jgi:lipid-A-disaccharide synthase
LSRVIIVAGDPSGDLVASRLVKSLKRLKPDLTVAALGGEQLKNTADEFLGNIVKQHALGFAISLKQINFFRGVLKNILTPEFSKDPSELVIPVDFYGFNSCVARLAKSKGHPVFYYVCPQFWASRSYRADRLRSSVDLFLCLFPFERKFYDGRNLRSEFVGHPILDALPEMPLDRPQRIEPHIGLLPGSRPDEVKRHLPVMRDACTRIMRETPGARFFVFSYKV